MVYKTIPASKKRQKLIHLILHLIALLAGIIGVYAVFNFHSLSHIIHMYTLHSWLGMATICLFATQWVLSLLTFWYPGARPWVKARSGVAWWSGDADILHVHSQRGDRLGPEILFLRPQEKSRSPHSQLLWPLHFPLRSICGFLPSPSHTHSSYYYYLATLS